MSEPTRWRITGTFTTTAPLHVGSGEVTTNDDLLNEKNKEHCDVQAVVKDYTGKPCIPGTALKGVLRAWAEQFYKNDPALDRLFGKRDAGGSDAESGKAEFHTVTFHSLGSHQYADTVPYWNATCGTGIASHVRINRVTGAAERNKLFFHEFVPEGVTFNVEITLARATAADVAFLLAVIEHGAAHTTHPYQFGASGADGWGRMKWARGPVTTWDGQPSDKVGYDCCQTKVGVPALPDPAAAPVHEAFTLTLNFAGPLLVNDTSRTHRTENNDRPHFTPLRRADGGVWLPASSFRGVLRSRAEFLLRSRTQNDDLEPIERLFGHTGAASRLTIPEFVEEGRAAGRHQDFVAIDRFTGGAAEGAKFHACYADRPTLTTTLTLDLSDRKDPKDQLKPQDLALFAAALRDVCRGDVPFGFGGAKGYGAAKGILDTVGDGWLTAALTHFPTVTSPAAPALPTLALTTDVLDVEANPNAKPRRFLRSRRPAGKQQPVAPWKELSKDIQDDDTIGGFEVEYELVNGQPVRVRRAGRPYIDPNPPKPAVTTATPGTAVRPLRKGVFANPYYFLRMADRSGLAANNPLADARPAGHDRLLPDGFSGTLRVGLTTKTPLLLLETDANPSNPNRPVRRPGDPDGHLTYSVRKDADNTPLLAASSVRGMLRSAYEAITNSRFGVFLGHDDRLGLRMATDEGLGLVPFRVAGGQIHMMPGTSRVTGRRPDGPMYAAWLPSGTKLGGTSTEPDHRQPVCCWVELWERTPWDRRQNRFRPDQRFEYWKVIAAGPPGQPLPEPKITPQRPRTDGANHHTALGQPPRFVADGFVCGTGYNFDRKHDERVFFADTSAAKPSAPLTDDHRAAWANLIRNYRINQDLVNGKPRPGALRHAGWSRHMTDDGELELTDGSLGYARLGPAGQVLELYPVMISRKLYAESPRQRLPETLRPAATPSALSPAERVFGWVNQEKTSDGQDPAHRGLVRVGLVQCQTPQAVLKLDPPVPLAILGQPKPAQGRFYLGQADGTAQPAGGTKEERGYRPGNRVRGPKVYPHHRRGPDPVHYKTPPGPKPKSKQNRGIAEWVKPDTEFTFTVHLQNLSDVELGALVWLLTLPAGQFLRLGLGKPLGFGSVRAEVVESRVNTGAEWVKAMPTGEPPPTDLEAAKATFVGAITAVNKDVLKAFQIAAEGFAEWPIHYPPAQPHLKQQAGDEEGGKHFQWFSENERESRDGGGRKLSLPDLTGDGDPSLPVIPN